MIIFLYGPDTYRSRKKLMEIINQYQEVHKSGLNLRYLNGKEISFQEFKNEIQAFSMFKEKKLIVIKDFPPNEFFKKDFIENFKKIKDFKDIIVFYEENKVLESSVFLKFLKKEAKCQKFEILSGLQLKNWVKEEFKKFNCKIGEKEIEKLIEFVGNDLWRFSNEINKLANFKKEIKEEDINLLIKPKIETDIFKTIDFLSLKNKKQALFLIKKHLEKGDHPLYLLSMINFQFRNLLLVKSCDSNFGFNLSYGNMQVLSKKLGMHPYVFKKSFQQAQRFSFEELKRIYQKIFQTDLNIKTGKTNPEIALDLLIAEI